MLNKTLVIYLAEGITLVVMTSRIREARVQRLPWLDEQ